MSAVDNKEKTHLTKRDLQRIETRNRVYEAAIDEFNRVGVANAQIEAIVKSADVSIGTYYRYFPSKDDVLFELIGRLMGDIAEQVVVAITDDSLSLEETLNAVITPIFDLFDKFEAEQSPLLREIFGLVVRQPQQGFEWIEHPMLTPIIDRFRREVENGNTQEDPVRLTRLFFTSMLGFITSMNPTRHRQESREFIRIFLRGIKS